MTTETFTKVAPDLVVAKHDEIRTTLLPLVYKTVLGGFRFDGFTTEIDLNADASYPLVTYLYLNHLKLDGYFENEAMSMYGIEAVLEWLGELGLMDGTVEFRLNTVVPADEQ